MAIVSKKLATKDALLVHTQLTNNYHIRIHQLQGKDHLVVPVVMMVEGVHHGSRGPLLYTTEELGKFASSWNGIPVMVGHPEDDDGHFTSANLPELTDQVVGHLYNCHMDGDKLKGEAWIDVGVLKSVSELAYEYINEGKALEVSIGVYSEDINISGDFKGEHYHAIATNLRPDHLALLPGEVGACSWDDGCGVRANMKTNKKGGIDVSKNLKELDSKELLKQGYGVHLISNETGFREIMQNIQRKLDQMDSDLRIHMLEDLFDDDFIYRVVNRETGQDAFFRRDYTVAQDGSIEFEGEPTQVRKDVSFVNLSLKRTKLNLNKKGGKMSKNASPCTVDALIKNQVTNFSEEDREWLQTLEQEQLDKLVPKEPTPEPVKNKEVQGSTSEEVKSEKKKDAPAANAEGSILKKNQDGSITIDGKSLDQLIKEQFGKETDPEKFIDNFMPEGLKGQMKTGLSMYHEKRENLIEGIVKNSKFDKDQLKDWKDSDLQKLHDSVVPDADYSALGHSSSFKEDEVTEEMNFMLNFPKKKEVEKVNK